MKLASILFKYKVGFVKPAKTYDRRNFNRYSDYRFLTSCQHTQSINTLGRNDISTVQNHQLTTITIYPEADHDFLMKRENNYDLIGANLFSQSQSRSMAYTSSSTLWLTRHNSKRIRSNSHKKIKRMVPSRANKEKKNMIHSHKETLGYQ